MCKCCETRDIFEGFILPGGGHLDIIMDSNCSEEPCFDIHLYIDGEFAIDSSRKINFCPICGDDLRHRCP